MKHQKIFAIDPGPTESAWVNYQGGKLVAFGKTDNFELVQWMESRDGIAALGDPGTATVIEMIASYGMAVGAEVFNTCVWIGRFYQACEGSIYLYYRKDIKMHLCGQTRAKDPNVRQALIDKFGPGEEKAIGKKKTPGPLYGVAGDVWAALAIAVSFAERPEAAIGKI